MSYCVETDHAWSVPGFGDNFTPVAIFPVVPLSESDCETGTQAAWV
ncbi:MULTISPECIES: hypothetical protein [Planktothrix]|nr:MULTISPECIES: hypothetical protein [Planktothrix]